MFKLIALFTGLFLKTKKQNFLILLQNNNELRATGGYISRLLDISIGKFSAKFNFRDVNADLDKHEYVEPPKPMKEMLNDNFYNGWSFRDANYNPDFTKSAEKLTEFYNLVYPKNKVAGILAVNFSFIENLLGIIGEININNQKVNKDNLFVYLSTHTSDIDRHDIKSIKERKTVINHLYKKIVKKCIFLIHKWHAISKLTNKSFENKDLQIWNSNRENKLEFEYPENSDCLAIIESNFLGGKSNRYIRRSIFREIQFEKDKAIIKTRILWEHYGKMNYPLSTRYRAYVRFYIPIKACNISEKNIHIKNKFKILDRKLFINPGEKTITEFEYTLKGDWLNNNEYKFKYIKQSGVYDEIMLETYNIPIQYKFNNMSFKNALIHENACSLNYNPEKNIEYSFKINKNSFGPRVLLHDFIGPQRVAVKFSEPVRFSNHKGLENLNCYHKDSNNKFNISHHEWENGNILYLTLENIPQKEEEFYVIELSNIENEVGIKMKESPRKMTVVYRSQYFK